MNFLFLNSLLDYVNVIGYEFHEYQKNNPVAAHHSSLYASKDDNLVGSKSLVGMLFNETWSIMERPCIASGENESQKFDLNTQET